MDGRMAPAYYGQCVACMPESLTLTTPMNAVYGMYVRYGTVRYKTPLEARTGQGFGHFPAARRGRLLPHCKDAGTPPPLRCGGPLPAARTRRRPMPPLGERAKTARAQLADPRPCPSLSARPEIRPSLSPRPPDVRRSAGRRSSALPGHHHHPSAHPSRYSGTGSTGRGRRGRGRAGVLLGAWPASYTSTPHSSPLLSTCRRRMHADCMHG